MKDSTQLMSLTPTTAAVGTPTSESTRLLIESISSSTELNVVSKVSSSSLRVTSGAQGSSTLLLGSNDGTGYTLVNDKTKFEIAVVTLGGGSGTVSTPILTHVAGSTSLTGKLEVTTGELQVSGTLSVNGNLEIGGGITRLCANGADGSVASRWSRNNHCYIFMNQRKTFQEAQEYCESMDAYLVTLKSPAESEFIKQGLQKVAKTDFYIGYSKPLGQSSFLWVTGEIAVMTNNRLYSKWYGEEETTQTAGQCAVVYRKDRDGADYGKSYRGSQSTTTSGRTCRSWNDITPHGSLFTPQMFPDSGIGNHNYCRNPDNRSSGPFCVTTDPNVVTENCGIWESATWKKESCDEAREFICERNF